jgi:DNA polymerase-3 subunit delta
MRLRVDPLDSHLKGGLLPCYLIAGDEPLQMGETADRVRHAAREAGFADRKIFEVQKSGFDWGRLQAEAEALSLFADKRLLDLRLSSASIGTQGSTALCDYARTPPPDTLLLITAPRLDRKQLAAKWVQALDAVGAIIQIWPVEGQRLAPWVEQRMRARSLVPGPGVVGMLAERVEGNLLAAAQEIDKLLLLKGPGVVSPKDLAEAVADNARFDVFALVDSALEGSAARCTRMLNRLNAEGVPEPVVLWALAREIRQLAAMAFEMSRGTDPARVMAAHKIWDKRKPVVRQGLQRLSLPRWRELLGACARADLIIKGRKKGDAWQALLDITVGMAGIRTHP